MRKTLGRVALALLAIAGVAVALYALYEVPKHIVEVDGLSPVQRMSAIIDERRTMLAALVAIGGAATLYYTHRRHQLDRDVSATTRYMQAVEQLSHTHVAVRLGGLYALERIAEDSPRDAGTVQEVVSAHVRRGKSLWASGDESDVATELTAAVRILGRSPHFSQPDLSGCDLHGLKLMNLSLPGANLAETSLRDCDLTDCDLRGADLSGCDLTNAWLDADLRGADLAGSTLRGATLHGAQLDQANMQSADLMGFDPRLTDLTGVDLRGALAENDAHLVAIAAAGGAVTVPTNLVQEHWTEIYGEIPQPTAEDFGDAATHYFVNFEYLARWSEHRALRGTTMMAVVDPSAISESDDDDFAERMARMMRQAHGSADEPGR